MGRGLGWSGDGNPACVLFYLCTLTFYRGSIHMVWKKYIFPPHNRDTRMIYVERKTFSQQNSRKKNGQRFWSSYVWEMCVLSYVLSALTVLKVYPQIRKSSRRRGRTIPQEYSYFSNKTSSFETTQNINTPPAHNHLRSRDKYN